MGGRMADERHRQLAFIGMALVAVGLPLSPVLMSIGQMVLAANWLLEREYRRRLSLFFRDPYCRILSAFYLLHVIGLAWAEDVGAGLRDVRVKLPLMVLPLLLFTSRLPSRERIRQVLMLFVIAVVAGSLLGLASYSVFPEGTVPDKRQLSPFVSHIRFGLMAVLSIAILLHALVSKWREWPLGERIAAMAAALYLLWFVAMLESVTAYLALGAMAVVGTGFVLFRLRNARILIAVALSGVLAVGAATVFVRGIWQSQTMELDSGTLPLYTLNGTPYEHYPDRIYTENGHKVWNYVCQAEMQRAWPKRSSLPFEGNDLRGEVLAHTLMRYLASKGLTKDSVGIHALTAEDVRNIEQGYTNHLFSSALNPGRRIAEALWAWKEFRMRGNPNNSSLVQRLVYTEVGLGIFREHWLIGVGTEGLRMAYDRAYALDSRNLFPEYRLVAHNQFLATLICLGIVGGLLLMAVLLYPLRQQHGNVLYLLFVVVVIVSFLSDNTLGTQAGVTFFAFMSAMLIIYDAARRQNT